MSNNSKEKLAKNVLENKEYNGTITTSNWSHVLAEKRTQNTKQKY